MKRVTKWVSISALLVAATVRADSQTLVVHEWGTFTSFQDARGETIPGINVDDEPVPAFVHRLDDLPIFTSRSRPALWSQGAPRCHPDVTLRLETPVLYFYPGKNFPPRQSLSVGATLVGGWLTEFYPFAKSDNVDFPKVLRSETRGSLQWDDLQLTNQPSIELPQTAERVWLAPRHVQASVVESIGRKEAEKYLFYRGVAHVHAPIVAREQADGITVSLRDADNKLEVLPHMWLTHVLPDGRVWYRTLRSGGEYSAHLSVPSDVGQQASRAALDRLRGELGSALIEQGLFEDEARAMLATWRLSYFESEGVRLFFLLPRRWTDTQLPLSVSPAAEITRVMLGRVELVSPHQRSVLQRLYRLPVNSFPTAPVYTEEEAWKLVSDSTRTHADFYRALGRDVPEPLRLYDSLGRFRDALLGHEWRRATDVARRTRLERVIGTFSACVPAPTER